MTASSPERSPAPPGRGGVSPPRRPVVRDSWTRDFGQAGPSGRHGSPGGDQNYQYWSNSKWGVPAATLPKHKRAAATGQATRRGTVTRPIPGHNTGAPGAAVFQEVQELEDLMRATLGALASFNADERSILLKEFRRREQRAQAKGQYVPPGLCTEHMFRRVWSHFSVKMQELQARAFFIKYGCDTEGMLPYEVFCERLLQSSVRVLGMIGTQKRAYQAGMDASFRGGIKERHCKRVVFPPSNWDGSEALRSAAPPTAGLKLEFVYGYAGMSNTAPNVFFTAQGHIVYYTAAIGIVYDPENHTQAFFWGHTDDIKCMSISPDRRRVASGQVSEQTKGSDRTPFVCIWDTSNMALISKISFPPEDGMSSRYIAAMAFSPCGTLLTIVCADNRHTLTVWDISKPRAVQITPAKPAFNGQPPQVYGICWNPYEMRRVQLVGKDGKTYSKKVHMSFVTYGRRHIKFWTWQKRDEREQRSDEVNNKRFHPEEYKPMLGRFGGLSKKGEKRAVVDDVLSAAWLPNGQQLVTGTPGGELLIWDIHGVCVKKVEAHGRGRKVDSVHDGTPSFNGVRGLCTRFNDTEMLSAGADGIIKRWDITGGSLGREMGTIRVVEHGQDPPAVRSLDSLPNSTAIVFGTARCNIWACSGESSATEVLLHGQHARVDSGFDHMAIACHPIRPHKFMTASEAPHVYYWNAKTHQLIARANVGSFCCRALAFSPDGSHLAVGTRCGSLKVLELDEEDGLHDFGQPRQCAGERVSVLKYSPSGEYLALGSNDNFIYIMDARNGYRMLCKCEGHSSYITHIDWSVDSRVLMSNCGAYDLLHFDPRSGRKLKKAQNDTIWDTWTCTLGFPVMGIWRDDDDGTDINGVCRTFPHAFDGDPLVGEPPYVVTARDDGKVHFFSYPCVVEDAPEREYGGHSSHVTGVRFTVNNRWVISVGGRDQTVFQWQVLKDAEPEGALLTAANEVEVYYAPQRKLIIDSDAMMAAAAISAPAKDIVSEPDSARNVVFDNEVVYRVTTVTSDLRGAQTSANVFCTLYGSTGEHTAELRLDNHPSNFERGRRDQFEVKGRDVKDVGRVRIGHDNTGSAPGWHLERVEIGLRDGSGQVASFLCGKWLAAEEGDGKCVRLLTKGGVAALPVSHKVKVTTSDLRGAGTSANVYITLFGATGDSGPRRLESSAKNFERGRSDLFELVAEVSEIESIRIGHDNSGLSPNWHIKDVEVSSSSSTINFPANRWLATDEDDGSTYVTLKPAGIASAARELKRYRVTSHTSDLRGAGTDANVFCTLFGQLGHSERKRLDDSKNNFERGMQDTFILDLPDVGELAELEIEHDNKGHGPGWHLEQVQVLDELANKTTTFPCDKWLAVDEDDGQIRRRLKPMSAGSTASTYRVVVYTSDLKGAGTDATVHLEMHGKLDGKATKSARHVLDTSKNNFERGSIDTFLLKKHPKMGEITQIVVGHNNKGFGPGWHLHHVEVVDEASGEDYYFPCSRWFDKGEDDGLLERILPAAVRDPNAKEVEYKVTVCTSDKKFAGTDANVTIEMVGECNGAQVTSGVQPLNNSKNNFERAKVDVFNVKSPNLGSIKHIVISHDNSSPGAGWHLSHVDIFEVNTGQTLHFPARRWLAKDEAPHQTSATLFPGSADDQTCRYKVIVHTSDCRGAGTDASVSCVMFGTKGQSGQNVLENSANNFERAQRDEFVVEGPDVGEFTKLQIGHDNRGLGPAWHLQHVECRNQNTNASAFFIADQWLDAKKGSTSITLDPSSGPSAKQVYQLKVITADCRGAGTDADISVILHGESGSSEEMPLDTSANNFERNMSDEFVLNLGTKDIGEVRKVDIGLASKQSAGGMMGSVLGVDWCLEACELTHMNSQTRQFFPYGDWLKKAKKRVTLTPGSASAKVQYKVVVKTSDLRGAGTDAKVSLVMTGERDGGKTTTGPHKLDNSANNFERNMEDTFYVTCPNMGTLETVQVTSDGSGFGGAWHLDHVEVWNMATGECTAFPCGKWLTPKDPMSLQQTLVPGTGGTQLHRYRVWVHTSDIRGAGTDANVSLEIVGDKETLPPRRLDTSANDFERGEKNEFVFEGADAGEIKHINIGHDNSGLGPGWHLQMVEIEYEGKTYIFPCNQWLEKGKDGLAGCRKQLFPGDAAAEGTTLKVEVVTSDCRGAGTDSNITCVVYGEKGDTGVRKLDSSSNDFERGSTGTFFLMSPDLGPIQSLRINSDDAGLGSAWHLAHIVVTDSKSGEQLVFPYNDWIDKKHGLSHLLYPDRDGDGVGDKGTMNGLLEYIVTVHTSDLRGAGTDSNVTIELHGDKGAIGETKLDNHQNNFERDRRDVFKITGTDVGEMDHIVIKHDNSGLGSAWHLASVEVEHPGLQKTFTFPCNDWLRKTKEAGMEGCKRTLRQGHDDGDSGPAQYRVTVTTSDIRGAGTDSNVTMVLYGSKGDTGERRLDSSANNFERGKVDTFFIAAPDVGEMHSLRLTSDGAHMGAAWRLTTVEVHNSKTDETLIFPFNDWIDREHGLTHLLYPDRDGDGLADKGEVADTKDYRITVYTSDLRAAGTDANVFIEVHGDQGFIGQTKLENAANNFERGRKDAFDVAGVDVGEITHVVMSHDNKGLGGAWHLQEVEVVQPFSRKTYIFPCGDWLQKGKETGMEGCKRTLTPGQPDAGEIRVTVHTSDVKGAGTDSDISVVIIGADGVTDPIPLDSSHNDFERGKADTFFLKQVRVGEVQKVRVISNGRGLGAAWHLDRIEVADAATGDIKVFPFRGWIDKKHGLEHELVPSDAASGTQCVYTIRTFTSDIRGAGTDARVDISIIGDKGEAGPHKLDDRENNFERGRVDEFEVEDMDVGDIQRIVIGHDNSWPAAAWHLQQVEVFHPGQDRTYYFPSNRWLQKSKEAGLEGCRAALEPSTGEAEESEEEGEVQYRVTVHTTDCRGAGTDSDISCIVYGKLGDTGTQSLDSSGNDFERGQENNFVFKAPEVGEMESLKIISNGRGLGAAWHLSHVEVVNTRTSERLVFPFHGWVDKEHGLEHVLQPDRDGDGEGDEPLEDDSEEYHVTVYTADEWGAATGASVWMALHGESGSVGETLLNAKHEKMRAGGRHDCVVRAGSDIGRLKAVSVRCDQKGLGSKWKLQHVEAVSGSTGEKFVFPFNSYIAGTTAVEIPEAGAKAVGSDGDLLPQRYKVVTRTSDIRFAGTDAEVKLELWGSDGEASGSEAIKLASRANNFERGMRDEFFVELPPEARLGEQLRKVAVHKSASILSDDKWHLDSLDITDINAGKVYKFECKEWLDKKSGLVKTWERGGAEHQGLKLLSEEPLQGEGPLPGAAGAAARHSVSEEEGDSDEGSMFPGYKLIYVTARAANAATNSSVYAQLDFELGELSCPEVEGTEGRLESGGVDEIAVESARDLGELESLRLWTDGAGSLKTWTAQRVVVQNLATREKWTFDAPGEVTPDGVTLQTKKEGDADVVQAAGAEYSVKVKTGSTGSRSAVSFTFYGSEVEECEAGPFPGPFKSNSEVVHRFTSEDGELGDVSEMRVALKGSGRLRLDNVELTSDTTGKTWVFACDKQPIVQAGTAGFFRVRKQDPNGGWKKYTAPHPDNPDFEVTFYHNERTGVSTYERPANFVMEDESDVYP